VREKNAVSILDRFAANRHLDDDVMAGIWTTAVSEGRTATHPHLATCAHCRARYAELTAWLEDLSADAHAEAEEAFPPERLAAQQAAILRRLEALERPARVIAFPGNIRPAGASQHFTRRWVATAAAAGLVIGLAAGQLLDLRHRLAGPTRTAPNPITSASAPVARQTTTQPPSRALDEVLFYDDDMAGRSSSIGYMPVLDEITPRARDEYDR
jgi:hypothetical protein